MRISLPKLVTTILFPAVWLCLALLALWAKPDRRPFTLEYAQVDLRVVDAATTQPVANALVVPLCMGLSPYPTNTYRTDTNGMARFMTYSTIAAPRITAVGYEDSFRALLPTNGSYTNVVVTLKRKE